MRYEIGDILFCMKTKKVFKYSGKEDIFYCFLATKEETDIFNKLNENSISFVEFKKISNKSDMRSKNRIYGNIYIDEDLYLLLRKFIKTHKYCYNYNDVFNIILNVNYKNTIENHQHKSIENKKESIIKHLEDIVLKIKKI